MGIYLFKGSFEHQVPMIHPRAVTQTGETWLAFCPQTSVLSSFLSMGKRLELREGHGLRWTDGLMLNIHSLYLSAALC